MEDENEPQESTAQELTTPQQIVQFLNGPIAASDNYIADLESGKYSRQMTPTNIFATIKQVKERNRQLRDWVEFLNKL